MPKLANEMLYQGLYLRRLTWNISLLCAALPLVNAALWFASAQKTQS